MIDLQTGIMSVVVYADRARVTRQGTVALEAGEQRVALSKLPLSLDEASVRASARGTARARLLGVDVRREFYTETPVERVRELEQQIEALQDERTGLDGQVALLQKERAAMEALLAQSEPLARGLAYGRTSVEEQMAAFDSLRQRGETINAGLLDLAAQRRELERRLEKLQRELDQLRSSRRRERYVAVVTFDVKQPGELTVDLTYLVSNAGWQPLYDVRLLEEEQPALEVGYLAQVTQRSGEDWTDIALTLSTARPALAETLPELDPWYVRPVLERAKRQARRTMSKMAAAPAPMQTTGADFDRSLDLPEAEEAAEEVMATVDTSGAAVTYQVPATVTVPSDGAPHKVTVARFELEPALDYVTAPKLVEAVYRRAQVTNDSPYTLLPGAANLFAQDEFIGATQLELIAPQGEIELYLGTDDRITVERELTQREVDKKLIGDRRRLRYAYQITLQNLLPVEAQVTLHDQVPVPRHENIKVKLETVEPQPEERTDLNLLEWSLALPPGEEQTVRFAFTVEHPRDMRVVGLP